MSQLPIRKLTLYKQGIGYFERQGQIEGNRISLVVPRDGINDVLKSLTIAIRQGGQVLGIDYETPEDKQQVLNELLVKLADRASLVDLLSSLRGSRVTLHLSEGAAATGRLVGVEASLDLVAQPATVVLQTDEDTSQIRVLSLSQVTGLTLHDDRAATDIGFFLDLQRTERTRTSLTVRLTEGQHELELSYLAPSPTWRVSYRLVGDGQGRARLLGWGLFDNSLDEDLDQVTLTLISGRPISFEYDLYESHIPTRPQVADDPSSLEAMAGNPMLIESLSTISHELRTPLTSIKGYLQLIDQTGPLNAKQQQMMQIVQQNVERMYELMNDLLSMARLREGGREEADTTAMPLYRAGPLGDLKASSAYFKPVVMGNAEPEFMTYPVETPVSVRRGQSAMVPIIEATVEYEEMYVYSGNKMPNHPLRVWRLQNTTGKALEQGPITLSSVGQYVGEGLMRFTGVGDEIQLAYALEFGILVTESVEYGEPQLLQVEFDPKSRQALVSRYQIIEYRYTLASHIRHNLTILIERRDPNPGEYDQMPEPAFAASGHTRWPLLVPANSEASFTIRVRQVHESREDVNRWSLPFIETLQAAGLVTGKQYQRLEQLSLARQGAKDAAEEIKTLQTEYAQLAPRQEQLRKNLETLGTAERELAIRNRVLDDLEASENRRREVEGRIALLNAQVESAQQQQQVLLDELFGEAAGSAG